MLNKIFRLTRNVRCQRLAVNFSFVCLLPLLANAQGSAEKGLPFVTNFSPKTFKAYPQVFSIIQDNKGLMYFGNQNYILQYDGVKWKKIDCSNGGQVAVRVMTMGEKGSIYYGAIGDFGYLAPDSVGQMKASSLLKYIPESLRSFNDIWTIYRTPEGVYFQSRERLFRMKEDSSGMIVASQLKTWEPKTRFMYAFYLDGIYYLPA